MQRPKWLNEVCAHCNCTRGSHSGGAYYSDHYKRHVPADYCPGTAGRMDWDNGPGTVFASTNKYKEKD